MSREPGTGPDPQLHLRMLPVITVVDPSLAAATRAGARRAGAGALVLEIHDGSTEALEAARASGAEVVLAIVELPAVLDLLNRVGRLGGLGLPVLGVAEHGGAPRLERSSEILLTRDELAQVNVAVPVVDAADLRKILWDDLRTARIEDRHHLVEVDGRPAIEELGSEPTSPAWGALAAGAAGVLAGRMAAANRRWQGREDR
jgi:hypothetical protein